MKYRCPNANEYYWKNWSLDMAELDCSTDESERSPLTKSFRRQENKICGVCGDRALGYNFNAITCESCKAFFRRNALKNKEFRCPFNDSCEVTSVTRRFCQRCRLRKCFEIGMKKEWILSEEEKQKKKKKIAINRARKVQSDPSSGGGQDDTLNEPPSEASCSRGPPELMVGDSDSGIQKHVGRGRPKGVRTRRRRYVEESPSPVTSIAEYEEPGNISASPHTETLQCAVSPEDQLTDVSAEGMCSITSTNVTDSTDERPSKSLARLFSNRENDCEVAGQILPTHKRQHTSSEIPSSSVEVFEEGGLMAGLLRSASQSPSELQSVQVVSKSALHESDINVTEPNQFNGSSGLIKRESNGSELVDIVVNHVFQEIPFNLQYPDQAITSSCSINPSVFVSPDSGELTAGSHPSVAANEPDKFEFSIQEALSMLQPGVRIREPTTYTQSVMDSIVNTAISAEYTAFRIFNSASDPGELNSAEKMKVHELYEANRGLLAPLCDDANFKDLPDPSLINVINLTEIAIRRLIKMSKKISSFQTLCQEDQIGLLKAGCTELMILKSVSAYDPEKDSWKIKQDQHSFKNIKLKVLKAAPGNVYEEHKRFILAFKTEWRQDINIMLLLSAIVLFTPERPFIVHPDAIRHEQSSYLYLLKRYLECKYSSCEGRSHYYKLLERISDLHVLNEDHVRVFLEANPKEMEPLLIEIFDLKQS